MLDLTRLTPAPWTVKETDTHWCAGPSGFPVLLAEKDDEGKAAVQFAALARNFADVMERRRWDVKAVYRSTEWVLRDEQLDWPKLGSFPSLLAAWQAAVDLDRKLTQDGR